MTVTIQTVTIQTATMQAATMQPSIMQSSGGRLLLIALVLLASGALYAQDASSSEGSTAQPAVSAPVSDPISLLKGRGILARADEAGVVTTTASSLNGAGAITLDQSSGLQFNYGYSFSGGWDSDPAEVSGRPSSGLFFATTYVAAAGSVGQAQYVLQYAPTFTKYTSDAYTGGVYHVASAKMLGAFNERWLWDTEVGGTYGKDALRLLGPSDTALVGNVDAAPPTSSSFLPSAGTALLLNLSGSLNYRRSERDTIALQLGDMHSHLSGLRDDDFASARLTYSRRMSQRFRVSSYGQTLIDSATPSCPSIGAGVGGDVKLTENTGMEFSVGPQFQAGGCPGNGASFNAAFNSRLTDVSQVYAIGGRQFTSGYLGAATWQTNLGGGYQRRILDLGMLSGDVNYTKSDVNAQVADYHGLFATATFGRKGLHGLSPFVSYRHLLSSTSGITLSRDVAMFSLTWQSTRFSESR